MLRTYIKIAWRQLQKNKLFGLVNIAGLAIGLTVSLMLFLYVRHETSFDRYHSKATAIYRVVLNAHIGESTERWAGCPNIAGPIFKKEISGVEEQARWLRHNFGQSANVSYGDKKFFEKNLYWADSSFTTLFDIPFVYGNPHDALNKPGAIIISESIAQKYFGKDNPLGKVLRIDNRTDCAITGVYKDFPANSTLDADLIGSFYTMEWMSRNQGWGNASFETYLLLNKHTDIGKMEAAIQSVLDKYLSKEEQWFSFNLQPLTDIHLHSAGITAYTTRTGDWKQVKILGLLALAILLIACINYMNLATARSQNRFRETGISKTMGASLQSLVARYYLETALYVLIAVVLSLVLMVAGLPLFNTLTNLQLSVNALADPVIITAITGITVMVILLSGSYPAFYLSRFNPKNLFHQTFSKSILAGRLRQALVVVQFSASVILIIATLLFYRQLAFIRNKHLGFRPNEVVAITTTAAENADQLNSLQNEVRNLAGVEAVCRAQTYPGSEGSGRSLRRPGDHQHSLPLTTCRATDGFIETLGLRLLAGKSLPAGKALNDTTVQVVLNKKAIEYLGYTPEEAIGKKVEANLGDNAYIVGVIDDFHSKNLYQPLEAYAFHNARTEDRNYMLVKFSTTNIRNSIQQLEALYRKHVPNGAFECTFLDQFIQSLYTADRRMAKIVLLFSVLAIFIACLGLFGLAAFIAEQKTKAIGIRKVLGASSANIVLLLSANFIKLVFIAIVIAVPLGWWIMNRWLENYAYRITIGWSVFAITGIAVTAIALLTVAAHAVKAAVSNPVRSLRSE